MAHKYNLPLSHEVRRLLAEKFPACFVAIRGDPKRPLKIGIRDDLFARLPDVLQGHISSALFSYTDGPTYLDALTPGAERIDLDGEVVGIVTKEEAAHAAWRSLGVSEGRRIDRELRKLRRVERAARWLIKEGLRLPPDGLIVIEKVDKSDPHYELCTALDVIEPLNPPVRQKN